LVVTVDDRIVLDVDVLMTIPVDDDVDDDVHFADLGGAY